MSLIEYVGEQKKKTLYKKKINEIIWDNVFNLCK